MKIILIIAFFVCYQSANGQGEVEKLAKKITSSCKTDRQKVTKIFQWITDNISYRTRNDRIPVIGKNSSRFNRDKFDAINDDTATLLPLNERVALNVLKSRLAVCDGFARLFTSLCDYAGIQSEIITGYADNGSGRRGTGFGVNHYWNAVFLEGKWQLLDASWASGYLLLPSGEFVRNYNPRYFLADPEMFIRDHYPEHPRWTLLPPSIIPAAFKHSPFRQKSFSKYSIASYFPEKGIIEASLGDSIELELFIKNEKQDKNIAADDAADSFRLFPPDASVCLTPAESDTLQAGRVKYKFTVDNPELEWVYLFYNNDIILRYKVNIKSRKLAG